MKSNKLKELSLQNMEDVYAYLADELEDRDKQAFEERLFHDRYLRSDFILLAEDIVAKGKEGRDRKFLNNAKQGLFVIRFRRSSKKLSVAKSIISSASIAILIALGMLLVSILIAVI